jgi:mono/diheme cytochrome c family protein
MQTLRTESHHRSVLTSALRVFLAAALTCGTFSAPAFAAGNDLYRAKCVACHGADGSGDTPMGKKFKIRDLGSADVQKQSDEELQNIIAKGKPPMPGFDKTLDAARIQQLVAYVRTLKK